MLLRFDYPNGLDQVIENLISTDTVPACSTFPAIDIIENEDEMIVSADLPGVNKEDIKISFEKNLLTISGERKQIEIPEKAHVVLNEMRFRDFKRSIRFAQDLEQTKISAEMNNGVLNIILPKKATEKATEITIQ